MFILNIAFMALISIAIVGFLAWSVVMQHRQYGFGDLRVGRRLLRSIKLASPDAPEPSGPTGIAPQM